MANETPRPVLVPMGDSAMLVRFASVLSDVANRAAIGFARRLRADPPDGVVEIDSTLVSVLVRFDPLRTDPSRLAGELRMAVGVEEASSAAAARHQDVPIRFGGSHGPDLEEVAALVSLTPEAFIARHNARPLRVLTVGFAPGFVYCGFHEDSLRVPRRPTVRRLVPAGAVLFAAGQTAITATPIPTGWHVIGQTEFCNFDAGRAPPTQLGEGDLVQFGVVR